jgi:putative transposase
MQTPRITLTQSERTTLATMLKKGLHRSRELMRARVLMKSADGMTQVQIAHEEDINRSTVKDICIRFDAGRLTSAIYDAPRSGQPQKLSDTAEAHLVALACSDAPEGRDHWTLELLQHQMLKDKQIESISTVSLWHTLNRRNIKPWREKNVVHSGGNP